MADDPVVGQKTKDGNYSWDGSEWQQVPCPEAAPSTEENIHIPFIDCDAVCPVFNQSTNEWCKLKCNIRKGHDGNFHQDDNGHWWPV